MIIIIIVIIKIKMIIVIIKGGEWMAYLRFFSVLLHPLKPIAIKKCNISDQVSL